LGLSNPKSCRTALILFAVVTSSGHPNYTQIACQPTAAVSGEFLGRERLKE